MDRNDRNILILGILILLLLAVGYYFLLFSPLRTEYLAAYDERTRKEASRQQLEQTVAQLENARRNAPDIERQILELSKRIPEQDEIPTLVVQIEEIARESDVTQVRIEPGAPEAPPGGGDFSRIPITMSFEGSYVQLQQFLLRVRNLARLVTVNEVNYEPVDEQGGATGGGGGGTTNQSVENIDNLLTVEIVAEVYVQPAAGGDTAAAAGAPAPPAGGEPKAGGAPKGGAPKGGDAKGGAPKGGDAKAGAPK